MKAQHGGLPLLAAAGQVAAARAQRGQPQGRTGGWLDVVPKKLAGDKVGYHVKMPGRKDPNNSGAQDTLPGKALDTPREAAIRRAEWIAEHPFPPKAEAARCARPLPHPFPNLIM